MRKRNWILLLPALAVLVLAARLDAQCCGEKAKADGLQAMAQALGGDGPQAARAGGTINAYALAALLKAKVPMTLIDARPGVDPKNVIPGAVTVASQAGNGEEVRAEAIGPKNRLVVTYCGGPPCNLSAKLAARLRRTGYTHVIEFQDGYAGWQKLTAACPSCAGQAKALGGVCPATGKTGGVCTAGQSAGGSGVKTAALNVMARIDTAGLRTLLDAKVPVVLVDARTGKYDDGIRIPGARAIKGSNDCWSKPATFAKLVPSKQALVVTYCGGVQCPLSSMVARKLRAAGYANVIEYKEGIAAWKKAGLKTVTRAAECCGACDKGSGDGKSGCPDCSSKKKS